MMSNARRIARLTRPVIFAEGAEDMLTRKELTAARLDAQAQGLRTYQGNPCQNGHDGTRYTATRHCVACSIAAASAARKKGE